VLPQPSYWLVSEVQRLADQAAPLLEESPTDREAKHALEALRQRDLLQAGGVDSLLE
jgi:hypothetical protein